jgi:hypothetical protein
MEVLSWRDWIGGEDFRDWLADKLARRGRKGEREQRKGAELTIDTLLASLG